MNDPVVAEQLIPKDHGFGIQRVPMETGYFETYNRANVKLVDGAQTPIVRVDTDAFQFDVIVYATDAFTAIREADKWAAGPMAQRLAGSRTFLCVGPQTAAS